MTYNPNVPQATDLISVSQGDLLTNFQQIGTVFDVDHVALDNATSANRGKHDKSTYVEQASDPTTSANEVAVYSKDNGSGASDLYLRRESNGNVIRMSSGTPTASQNGYSFLPGGILIQWGRSTIAGSASTQAITFPTAFSGTAYVVDVTPYASPITGSSPREIGASSITSTGFTAESFNGSVPGGGVPFGWIAIGPA